MLHAYILLTLLFNNYLTHNFYCSHQFLAYKPFSNFANISDVSCNGAESNLLQCSHKNELNNQCNLLNIVGIQCGK